MLSKTLFGRDRFGHFGETVRDILKDDFRICFRKGFEAETLGSL